MNKRTQTMAQKATKYNNIQIEPIEKTRQEQIKELAGMNSVWGRSFWDVVYTTVLTTDGDQEILKKLYKIGEILPCSICQEHFKSHLDSLSLAMDIYNVPVVGKAVQALWSKLPFPYNEILTPEGVDWFAVFAMAHNNINDTEDRTKDKLLDHIYSERVFRKKD